MTLSRRRMLQGAGAAIGLGAAGTIGYQFRPTTAAAMPASGAGGDVLVTYASMMGSTGKQAQTLAETLRASGRSVHLAPVSAQLDPNRYSAVLMGSPVRRSMWLDDMVEWAATHQAALANMPSALFQCSMTCAGYWADGNAPTDVQIAALRRDMGNLLDAAPALSGKQTAFFPGAVNYDHLPPTIRLGYPVASGTVMIGDYRQPALVQDWGAQLIATGVLA